MLEKETQRSNRQNVREQYKHEQSEARSSTCGEGGITDRPNTPHTELIIRSQDSGEADIRLSPRAGWLLYRTSMMERVFFTTRTRHLTRHQKYSTNLSTPPAGHRNSDCNIKNVREGINVCMH